MKTIALKSSQDYGDAWFNVYFEVPDNFDFNVEKFEERFMELYTDENNDEYYQEWSMTLEQVAEEFGMKEVYIEEFELGI